MWGFPRIRGTFLGGPNNTDYSIWGSILGPLFWETTMYLKIPETGLVQDLQIRGNNLTECGSRCKC